MTSLPNYCSHCGEQILVMWDQKIFCGNCGVRIVSQPGESDHQPQRGREGIALVAAIIALFSACTCGCGSGVLGVAEKLLALVLRLMPSGPP